MYPCAIRNERDVDWVVEQVGLGLPVMIHVGGLRRRGREGLSTAVTLGLLRNRLTAAGGHLALVACENGFRRMVRGRVGLAFPAEDSGSGNAGVREPRRPPPGPRAPGAFRPLPTD